MSYVRRLRVSAVSISDGSVTAYSEAFTGKILSIQYVKTDYANTVDFEITSEATGAGIWTEANVTAAVIKAPRQATHDIVGLASLHAAGGEPIEDYIGLANDRVKIAITNAGDTKTGVFYITVI